MQSVEPSGGAARPTRGPLSPVVAFVALIAVLALLGSIIFLTRPDTPKPTAPLSSTEEETHFALTDEEAKAEFERLNEIRHQAFEERDPTLISFVYTSDSPVASIAEQEIEQLVRDDAIDHSEFRTRDLSILDRNDQEVVLREVVEIRSRFLDARGRDVTTGPDRSLQVVVWTLRLEEGVWQLHDSVIKKSRVIR